MRGAIAKMDDRLPDKRSTANPIQQSVPLSGQADPDRPLSPTASRNNPALGVSSNEGDRDSGARSNREGCATSRTRSSTGSTRHRMRNPQTPNLNPDRATPISDPTSPIPDHGSHNARSRFRLPCPLARRPR
ncbi:hypothetical protein GCM10007291_49200 [Gemmobacter nanjingensis]|uniref:Uncharacterized protein n=1 Tax=Gemmobacter nanjingensis TaxID=488454 RepID=A0ABQ3FTK7_9RHOB|nr:hypothetical protein GCM10007291_49200 [Gemmobacter nanjingensis]